jgi:hypothetical protein
MILTILTIAAAAIVAGVATAAFIDWMSGDPNRDVVLLMGCKQTGKTESLSALRGEKFNPSRSGSGVGLDIEKMALGGQETPLGNKLIACIDSGGDEDNKINLIKASVKYLEKNKAEYFLLLLVVDLRKLDQTMIDATASRLAMFVCDIENRFGKGSKCPILKKCYDEGRCGYAIIGTHKGQRGAITDTEQLADVARDIAKKKRKFRCLYEDCIECFELSEDKDREKLCTWLMNTLKRLHK